LTGQATGVIGHCPRGAGVDWEECVLGTIIGALLIGISLGLLGSGGSVVTVPVLVYVLGHDGKVAVAESLGIVGAIALAAGIPYGWARLIDWRSVLLFGLPGMAGTYGGAWLASYVPGPVQLVLFAGVMLLAAWMMFRQPVRPVDRAADSASPDSAELERHRHPAWKIAGEGLVVGVLTGLVGVGGGFLIVPALVLLGGLSMRLAVGTSLLIVAAKSLVGFAKYQHVLAELDLAVDWSTIGWFVVIGVLGTLIGARLAARLNQRVLQHVFVVFLLVMGCFVLSQEIPKIFAEAAAAGPE
jgi:uncharacterized protein